MISWFQPFAFKFNLYRYIMPRFLNPECIPPAVVSAEMDILKAQIEDSGGAVQGESS